MQNYVKTWQDKVNADLDYYIPNTDTKLHQAMRYAALSGGKRIRGLLAYAGANWIYNEHIDYTYCNSNVNKIVASLECMHAYSLIHDDLPCMDNDDLRRGKLTTHKVYGEALALLAGDALQTLAFELVADTNLENIYLVLKYLAQCSGSRGMAGGQAIDIIATMEDFTLEKLEQMHLMKTGALLEASVCMGILATEKIEYYLKYKQEIKNLTYAIGLGFQVIDDILDVTQDSKILGKTSCKDITQNKCSYVTILGVEKAKDRAKNLHEQALSALNNMHVNSKALLYQVTDIIFTRNY